MSGFPRQFGDYLLLGSIGHGGMGEVFLAKVAGPAGIERLCVVKVVRADADDPTYVGRFLDEARIMCQLSHGNICHLNDVGVNQGQFYLSMEHIFGVTLKELVNEPESGGDDFRPIAVYVIGEVLKGLDYAHRNKNPLTGAPLPVVHRDISPQNVMVNFEGEVKLIDFGLAASDQKIEQTDQNTVMGKIAYMSPEQARGEEVDGRSDEFTAAILAYEIIAGERFYDPSLPPHTIWGLSGSGGVFPNRFNELPEPIRDTLRKALSPRPQDRYPTCGAFREALLDAAPEGLRSAPDRLREFMEKKYGARMRNKLEPLAELADLPFYEGPLAELMTPLDPDSRTEASMPSIAADEKTEASAPVPDETQTSSPSPEPTTALSVDGDTGVTGSHPRQQQKSNTPRLMAAGLGLVVVLALVFAFWPSDEPPPPELANNQQQDPPVLTPPPPEPPVVTEPPPEPDPKPVVEAPVKRPLRLRSTPRGATVSVVGQDGVGCTTPCEIQAEKGAKISVIFTRLGYRPVKRSAVVDEDGTTIRAKLSRDARTIKKVKPPAETKRDKLKDSGKIKGKNAVADPWAR
jgi:serine/threonine-protein kinase